VSHGFELEARAAELPALPRAGALGVATRALAALNRHTVIVSALAILGAASVLTGSVVTRYFFKVPTDWQDEAAVFLMVGATFLTAAQVQAQRGHVAIAALASILPPRVNRARALVADLVSLLFCTFFTWKSWALLHEAVVDGQTSSSSWGPPMWIPYSLMTVGMTLLTLQLVLQVLHRLAPEGATE
jgi:TRAP-type C4-dicarboxylate transport system permease small subunit